MTENLLEKIEAKPTALMQALSVKEVARQIDLIKQAMKEIMVKDVHYGVIPGCKKPSLQKPGAELLRLLFQLSAVHEIEIRQLEGEHRECISTCTILTSSGRVLTRLSASCSTMEKKYRYRDAERECPKCGKPTIIKGKEEFGGGWVCFRKKGGCGAKFLDDDAAITCQKLGQVENLDLADLFNTILKMAEKRADVGATLSSTAASEFFTQDIEDIPAYLISRSESMPGEGAQGNVIPADELPERAPEYYEYDLHRVEDAEQREVLIAWGTKAGCIYDPAQMRLKSKKQIKKLKAMEVYVPQGAESHV